MLLGSSPLGSVAFGSHKTTHVVELEAGDVVCTGGATAEFIYALGFISGSADCLTSCDGEAELIFVNYSHDIPDAIPTGIECSMCGFEFKLSQLTMDKNKRLVCKRCLDK